MPVDETALTHDIKSMFSKFNEIEYIYVEKRKIEIFSPDWKQIVETKFEYGIDIIVDVVDQPVWDKIGDTQHELERKHPDALYTYQIIERVGAPLNEVYDTTNRRLVYQARKVVKKRKPV